MVASPTLLRIEWTALSETIYGQNRDTFKAPMMGREEYMYATTLYLVPYTAATCIPRVYIPQASLCVY